MKVLVVHNRYKEIGGEYVAVNAQTDLLRRNQHVVLEYSRNNAEIDSYSSIEKVRFFPDTVYSRRTYAELVSLVRSEKPDIAHVHNVFPLISPSAYIALHDLGIPTVQTVHNFRFLCPNALFLTNNEVCERCINGNTIHAIPRKCYQNSIPLSALYAGTIAWHRHRKTFDGVQQFIALTEFTKSKLVEGGVTSSDKIQILGNFLPEPLPTGVENIARKPSVLFLGRLSIEKGPDVFVKAAAAIPAVTFLVAGDGPERQRLESLALQSQLNNVRFLGRIGAQEKGELLQRIAATIIPSTCYDNLPYTLLESWAANTPVIASRIGGLASTVEHAVNGFLFRPGDVEDLQQQIQELIANPKLGRKLGEAGRRKLDIEYSESTHYRRLMDLYNQILDL